MSTALGPVKFRYVEYEYDIIFLFLSHLNVHLNCVGSEYAPLCSDEWITTMTQSANVPGTAVQLQ